MSSDYYALKNSEETIFQQFVDIFSITQSFNTLLWMISIVFAIVIYNLSKKKSQLSYSIKEFSVVGSDHSSFLEDLELRFQGKEVSRVTASDVLFWNSGNTTYRNEDIIQKDKIRLVVNDNCKILKSEVKNSSCDTNDFNLYTRVNEVEVDFLHIEPQQGAKFRILHTSSIGNISMRGSLIGLKENLKIVSPELRSNNMLKFSVPTFALGVMLVVLVTVFKFTNGIVDGSAIGFVYVMANIYTILGTVGCIVGYLFKPRPPMELVNIDRREQGNFGGFVQYIRSSI